ncbi:MAG: GerMN domain-containing protein [Acidimicrobiales bacterium]|nr:GerMN domain-containing protein [Acidimicrobiales bacterium]
MRGHRGPWALVTAFLLVGVLAACGSDGGGDAASTTAAPPTSAPTSTSAPSGTSTTAAGGEADVLVYFARDEGVATAGATVPTPAVAGGALVALLAGPDDVASGAGMSTEIPDGTRFNSVVIDQGTATVDLSAQFASGGGSLSMQLRVAQVVFTLTQFDTVAEVDIHLDGEAVDGIGGEGVPAEDLTRADFEDVTPLILVESPVPGEAVTSPIDLGGLSNTFEANVRYTVTAADGTVLADGFTTATAGTGTWGTFSESVALDGSPTGAGTVTAFEESAEDGSRVNVYEVPVTFG